MLTRRELIRLGLCTAFADTALHSTLLSPASASMPPTEPQKDVNNKPIDRKALVTRHNVTRTTCDDTNPVQIGNGHFAFGADITGLQTFIPFNTMSDWGWHTFPLPTGEKESDFVGDHWDFHGRDVVLPSPDPVHPDVSRWLYNNPHRINLGRIGLTLTKSDGSIAAIADISDTEQRLDLWNGLLISQFQLETVPVTVETACHPAIDMVAVRITSPLVALGRLTAFVDFPYDDHQEFENFVGDWDSVSKHQTPCTKSGSRVNITHQIDRDKYQVAISPAADTICTTPAIDNGMPIKIISATYGSGSRLVDVAPLLTAAIQENRLSMDVTNENLGGDPALGQVKALQVNYTVGGQPMVQSLTENSTFAVGWSKESHRFKLSVLSGEALEFVCAFAPDALPKQLPDFQQTKAVSATSWNATWSSGGAIDLSGSTDARWFELERRIVLSQYLLLVNEAGSYPPQESGLVNNGWNGKFHMEMYWWHAAHYALWNRWDALDRSNTIYERFLPVAKKRAAAEGFLGARWPKMTSPDSHESPHQIHALLIWQCPHPLFFAELDYRAHPTAETLHKWKDVVFETANFLASFAFLEHDTDRYVLGPPVFVVSENTDPKITKNPTFELSYWKFGLRIARQWRARMGLAAEPLWDRVASRLAPLPQEDGLYVLYEGVPDMWTKFNFEHPALIGVYGMLPGDGVDRTVIQNTLNKVFDVWHFDRTWGWDYPMLAMTAARLGDPAKAVDLLLTDTPQFGFSDVGLARGGPYPYMPSNGGLLYAAAMMAAGWDGLVDTTARAPGFPQDGSWSVVHEGLSTAI